MELEMEALLVGEGGAPRASRPRWMWAQLYWLSVAVFLVFTAFSGVQNLESTLKFPEGLSGTTALAILYGAFSAFSLLSPSIVILLGTKFCIVAQAIFLTLFVGATWIPHSYTLYVAAGLAGAGSPVFWVAQGVFVTWLAAEHAAVTPGTTPTAVVGTMQGIFFFLFQMTQISGNMVSSSVFHAEGTNQDSKRLLFLVYIGCGVAAVLMKMLTLKRVEPSKPAMMEPILALHSLSVPNNDDEATPQESPLTALKETLSFIVKPRSLLLLPLFLGSGFQTSFTYGSMTAVVKRSIGQDDIGFVMCCYGACDALGSLALGRLSDKLGRAPLLLLGCLFTSSVLVTLMVWEVPENTFVPLFALAGLLGLGDAVSQVICSSLCSVGFGKSTKPAFAMFRCIQSLASAILYSLDVDMDVKAAMTLIALAAGTSLYFVARACYSFDSAPKVKTLDLVHFAKCRPQG